MSENTASGPAETGDAGGKDALTLAFEAAAEGMTFADGPAGVQSSAAGPPADRNAADHDEAEPFAAPGRGGERAAERSARRGGRDRLPRERRPAGLAPPAHWDAAKREAFARLPDEAKQIVLDLGRSAEAHMTRRSQEHADERRFASSVRSLIHDGHRDQMRRSGIRDEVEGIETLLRINDWATRDPLNYVRWVARMARLDARTVFPELGGGAPAASPTAPMPPIAGAASDPRLSQLEETIRALSGKVSTFERAQGEANRRRQQMLRAAVARFRDASDEEGAPKHPYYARVEGTIADILASHPQIRGIPDFSEQLRQAYDLAVLADPELRERVLNRDSARRESERRREAEVEKARRAKAPIRSIPSTPPARKATTLDEAVRKAMGSLGMT